jgi:hypothetical protein
MSDSTITTILVQQSHAVKNSVSLLPEILVVLGVILVFAIVRIDRRRRRGP